MIIWKLLREGLKRSWKLRRVWFGLWGLNLLIAGFSLLPYQQAFHQFFRNRPVTSLLARDNIYTFFSEFFYYQWPSVKSALRVMTAGSLVYALITLFISGGIIYYFGVKEPVRFTEFFRQAGCYLWRMVKLTLLQGILWMAALVIGTLLVLPLRAFLPSRFIESQYFYFLLTYFAVVGFLFILVSLLIDMARLRVIQTNRRAVWQITMECLPIFLKHPRVFLVYYGAILTVWVLAIFIYWKGQQLIPNVTIAGVITEFLWLQMAVFGQYLIRCSRFGGLQYLMASGPDR